MDMDFKWTSRDEKLEVVRYWWRAQRAICHLCNDPENPMEPYSQVTRSPWGASIEHLIPKRENGPDTAGNVRLAHRWCNNVLGALWQINQDRAAHGLDPISKKWALSSGRRHAHHPMDIVRAYTKSVEHRDERGDLWRQVNAKYPKAAEGTLAQMIERGEVSLPRGATLPKQEPHKTDNQILAEMDWPWLRDLVSPRVRAVGWGA